MGALTLGANWVQREFSGDYTANKLTLGATPDLNTAAADPKANGTNIGYGLSATYALSKRTSFIADYTAYTGATGSVGANNNRDMTTVYNLFLSHSF
jgi:hypothetical protein